MSEHDVSGAVERLEPCPFCGDSTLKVDSWATWYVQCIDCGAKQQGLTKGEAIAAWNCRAVPPHLEEANREIERRDAVAREAWGDQADEYTDAITAAHPVATKDHDTFAKALAMVGKRHGKYELVGLVNWLLARAQTAEAKAEALAQEVQRLRGALEPICAEFAQTHPLIVAARAILNDPAAKSLKTSPDAR